MDYLHPYYLGSQETPSQPKEFNNDKLAFEEEARVWWIVLFTCVFQTLYKVPARAMEWLLKFFGVVTYFLGKFADLVKWIASQLPNINYLRAKYLQEQIVQAEINYNVLCPKCHQLHNIDK